MPSKPKKSDLNLEDHPKVLEKSLARAEAVNNYLLKQARKRDPSPLRYEVRNFEDLSKSEQAAYQMAPWLAWPRGDIGRDLPAPKDSRCKKRKTASTQQDSNSKKAVHPESEDEDISAASGSAVKLSFGGKKFVDDDDDKEEDERVEDTHNAAADGKR